MKKLITLMLLVVTILSSAQSLDKNVAVLKKWTITNGKEFATKTNFTTTEQGQTKAFFLSIRNQTIELKDAETKQVVEKYQNFAPAKTANISCKVQEANQWDVFKKGLYIRILEQVNKTCISQRYCLMIYCNGIATVSYMLLIKPTKCPVTEVTYNIPD